MDNKETPTEAVKKALSETETIDFVKIATTYVVGAGAGTIVKQIIANNTDTPEGIREKITMYAGAAVLGMVAKDASKKYMGEKIDGWYVSWKRVKAKIEAKNEPEHDSSMDTNSP